MSSRILTFGDICSAIADGKLSAASDGSVYKINGLELRRYFNNLYSFPSIVSAKVLDVAPCPDTSNRSTPPQSSAL